MGPRDSPISSCILLKMVVNFTSMFAPEGTRPASSSAITTVSSNINSMAFLAHTAASRDMFENRKLAISMVQSENLDGPGGGWPRRWPAAWLFRRKLDASWNGVYSWNLEATRAPTRNEYRPWRDQYLIHITPVSNGGYTDKVPLPIQVPSLSIENEE